MKTSQRHHLKENELAILLGQANDWASRHQRPLTIVIGTAILIAVAAGGYAAWRNNLNSQARAMLVQAMVVQEARVQPPTPAAPGTTTAPEQPAGTYPTNQARLEAALPKFLEIADTYPSTDPGRLARYQAAGILVSLSRFDEAMQQYDRVISDGSGLLPQMARLGKAEAQLRASQFDPAIGTFKEMSERTDLNLPKEALLLELARAYRLAGKTAEATQTLNQIVEQHGQSPIATEAREELNRIKG